MVKRFILSSKFSQFYLLLIFYSIFRHSIFLCSSSKDFFLLQYKLIRPYHCLLAFICVYCIMEKIQRLMLENNKWDLTEKVTFFRGWKKIHSHWLGFVFQTNWLPFLNLYLDNFYIKDAFHNTYTPWCRNRKNRNAVFL